MEAVTCCCWVFRGLEQTSKTLFDRNSSSPDSPLIQTIVSLPHVVLEMVPLYIHAGQYASIACTQCSWFYRKYSNTQSRIQEMFSLFAFAIVKDVNLWLLVVSHCCFDVLGYRFTVVRASQGVSSCALPHRKQNGSGAGGGDGRGTIRCLHVFWSQTGTAAPPVRTDGSCWWTVLVMSSCFISTENLVFMQHLCVFSIYL